MRKGIVVSIAASLVLTSCVRLHKVVPASRAENADYVYYALPLTMVDVSMVAVVTEVKAEAACTDAKYDSLRKHLGLKKPPYTGKVFSVASVALAKRTEADPHARYAVEIGGKSNRAATLNTNVHGLPSAASSQATSIAGSVIGGVAKFVGTVLGAVVGAQALDSAITSEAELKPEDLCVQRAQALQGLRDQIIYLSSSDGAADPKDILDLKRARLLTASKGIEGLFTGVVPGKLKTIVCSVDPGRIDFESGGDPLTGSLPLFSWTLKDGVATPLSECSIPAELGGVSGAAPVASGEAGNKVRTALAKPHSVSLEVVKRGTDLASHDFNSPKQTDRSFYYRIPAITDVAILDSFDGKEIYLTPGTELAIAQLGKIASLPRLRTSGSAKISVKFDPDTGALLEFGSESKSIDIGGVLGNVNDLAAGYLTARKEAAAADPELAALQRERAVLEALVAIRAAEETLASTGGNDAGN